MTLHAVLVERFPVVRGDHDHRALQDVGVAQRLEKPTDQPVRPVDRLVVGVGVAGPEDRRDVVVDVLMHVHVVQVEQEALVRVLRDEVGGGDRQILVGSRQRARRRVLAMHADALRAGHRLQVHVEALGEAEVGLDPAIPPHAVGAVAGLLEQLGGNHRRVGQDMVVAQDAVADRMGGGPQGGHRGLRPSGLGHHVLEEDPVVRRVVEDPAGGPLVAVDAQAVGPQRVDQDEHHVQVVAIAKLRELADRGDGARGNPDLELGGDGGQQQHPRENEVRPA